MIGFGNFRADDFIQLFTLALSIIAFIRWCRIMAKSKRPLYILPPIIATGSISLYYLLILFASMDTETATLFSAARSSIDAAMWLLSSISMSFTMQRGGNV